MTQIITYTSYSLVYSPSFHTMNSFTYFVTLILIPFLMVAGFATMITLYIIYQT